MLSFEEWQKQQGGGGAPSTPVAAAPSPASPSSGGFDLGSLWNSLTGAVGQGVRDVTQRPLDTLLDVGKGALQGTLGIGRTLSTVSPASRLYEMFGGPSVPEQQAQITDLAHSNLLKPTTATGKAVEPLAEFLPALAVPETKLAEGIGFAPKLFGFGEQALNFIAKSQSVYLPDEHTTSEVQDRMNRAWTDLLSLGGLELGGKVAGKLILQPMKNAYNMITDGSSKFLKPELIDNSPVFSANGVSGVLGDGSASITRDDFINTINGLQPIDDSTRSFFSTPEWKSVVGTYKTDYAGYPDQLVVKTAPVTTDSIAQGASTYGKLLDVAPPTPHAQLESLIPEISSKLASQEVDALPTLQADLNSVVRDAKLKYGMNIDLQGVKDLISDYTNFIRKTDDLNAGVAHLEMSKETLSQLEQSGLKEPLQLLSRISSLVKGGDADPLKIIGAYERSAAAKNMSSSDRLIEALQTAGFNVNEPGDLVAFAKSMPTQTMLTNLESGVKATQATEPNLSERIATLVKEPQAPRIDTPYQVGKEDPARANLEALITPEEKAIVNEHPEGSLNSEISPQAFSDEKPVMSVDEINKDTMLKPSVWESVKAKAIRTNPLSFESAKIASYGEKGKEMVDRVRRAFYDTIQARGELRELNTSSGVGLLSAEEWSNLRDVTEGKATALNERVLEISKIYKDAFNKWADRTQVAPEDRIAQYWPRGLNDEGRQAFANATENSEIVKKIMDEQGVSSSVALKILRSAPTKGSFEYSRIIQDLPPQYRAAPQDELMAWEEDAARRVGQINNFGKDNSTIRGVMDDISLTGQSLREQGHIADQVDAYYKKAIGKAGNYTEIGPIYNYLKTAMVGSKLSPLTTIGNEFQGWISSYLEYGVKGLYNSLHSPAGDDLVKKLGLDDLKGKYGDEMKDGGLADKWMKLIGMQGSEIRGFSRSASSTYEAIQSTWDTLKKDPTNIEALGELKRHAMFLDNETLQTALKSGEIPPEELAYGVLQGVQNKMFFQVPGERPSWATKPGWSVAYIFHNYLLAQMRLLAQAPIHRQIAYVAVIAPLMGLPILTLRRVITGGQLPQTPQDWYFQSMTAGSGTPLDLLQPLQSPDKLVSYAAGGYSPVTNLLFNKDKGRAAIESLPLPAPSGQVLENMLFPRKSATSTRMGGITEPSR